VNPDHTQEGHTPPSAPGRETLGRVIARLARRYRDASPALSTDELTRRLAALQLAEAALRDIAAVDEPGTRPPQVAVMGPTQVGKSTVVNLLLGQHTAKVSPLAGFTIHPQGFALPPQETGLAWIAPFFPGWERLENADLNRDKLDCYTLRRLTGDTPGMTPGTVVWDTPDFDSFRAHSYQRGVLEVAALADVIMLVVSREKYADLSVWKTLQLLEPLRRSLVVCLNKTGEDARDVLVAAMRTRLAELTPRAGGIEVIAIPYCPGIDNLVTSTPPPEADELRAALQRVLTGDNRGRRAAGVHRLLLQHWTAWMEPVRAELEAAAAWEQCVAAAIGQALIAYRDEFLEHPQRFDTFRLAILELLQLLELPGLARVLTRVRQTLTWPARRLLDSRKLKTLTGRLRGRAVRDLPGEELVLRDLLEHLLTSLSRDALRRGTPQAPDTAFWQALGLRLAKRHAELTAQFAAAAHRHHLAFQSEIESAAHDLYENLQQKPALLNTLRAARLTTDAAGIAIALKTGGVGLNDVLFAPAMVSLTSMLTEGALGSYMTHAAGRLKQRQYAAVERDIFNGPVREALRGLTGNLEAPGLFGISRTEYAAAEQTLAEWRHD
jgi:50S ribosome-binding GTPase